MLDTLMAAGEVVWAGVEPLGERDGRIALYLTDHMATLAPAGEPRREVEGRAADILGYLRSHGASFFAAVHEGDGRRISRRDGERPVGPRLARPGHQRHAPRAARLHQRAGGEACQARAARTLQVPAARAANGRRPVVSRGHAPCIAILDNGVEHGHRAPTARPSRRRDARDDRARACQPAAFRPSIKSSRRWKMPDASGAGTSSPAWAPPSLPCLPRSTSFDRCAIHRTRSRRSCCLQPIRRRRTARCSSGRRPHGPTRSHTRRAVLRHPGTAGRGPTRTTGALVVLVDGYAAGYLRRGEQELLLCMPAQEPARSHATQAVARALVQMSRGARGGTQGPAASPTSTEFRRRRTPPPVSLSSRDSSSPRWGCSCALRSGIRRSDIPAESGGGGSPGLADDETSRRSSGARV